MNTKIEFTIENTYYYSTYQSGLPMREEKIERKERQIKKEAAGRLAIGACCPVAAGYLNGALEIGIDAEQKAIFERFFDHNKDLTNIWSFRRGKGNKEEFAIKEMLENIFEAVTKIGYPHQLQNYFLDCILTDVKEKNRQPRVRESLHEFLRLFEQRLEKGFCNTTEFKTDLSQLCERCPLKKKIPEAIQIQIIAQAKENKEIMPQKGFTDWIEAEVKSATGNMQKMRINAMGQGQRFLPAITETYIWNKERAKALKTFFKPSKPELTFDELTPVIIEALSTLELLNDEDNFIGKPGHIKTLFAALTKRGWLAGTERRVTVAFPKYFKKTFEGDVSDRTLRAALTKEQEELLTTYKAAIPKK